MSTTIGDLVNRVYREYLEAPDDLESYSYLTGGINSTATTLAYDDNLFSSEEEDALGAGTVIEINKELMYTTALNTVNNEITVTRGARGTTKVSHSAGDIIKVSPTFTRQAVYDAIVDQIENLYPTLFAVETQTITAKSGINILDGATDNYLVTPIKAISQYTDYDAGQDETGSQFRGVSVELVDLPNPFTYTNDSGSSVTLTYTGGPSVVHALQNFGISSGKTMYISFKKKFVEPANKTTTLVTIGLENV